MKPETLTLILVNLAGIMERADESLLPGVYKEIGAALHADPTSLGSLTFFRSIVQSSCYPLAAYLSVYHNRTHVIALGALLWAAATFLVGISSTFFQVAVSRALNGIGLAIVTPAIQSLVADSTDDSNRGTAFGWLQLTANIGSIFGGLLSVLIASTSFMGIPGWRISFHLVAILSVVIAVLVRLFANDPNFVEGGKKTGHQSPRKSFLLQLKDLISEAKAVLKIPSFQIIVAQGVSGSFPWSALSFAAMWLELIGFSHKQTAFLMGMFVVASSLGGLFGGKMGDILSQRFPNSGRIVLSQISSASAIPLTAMLMLVLPDDPSTAFMHGLVLFITGLCISWNAAATNKDIGILSQRLYGYKPVPQGSSESVGIETDRENAASLAKALYTTVAVPMALCCFIYSFLYRTYPRDRERARMEVLIESEMEQIESDNPPAGGEYSQLRFSGTDEHAGKESVIEIDYEEDGGLGQIDDESDEKTLLSRELTFSNLGD
ncbi:Major facilitator superfamily protein [Thalictrum thalictroides]|uniref:Major facilitator superfamily protein n=1 Tax=Thalictrum thalictroides TaxID=46969 RepID=A0A7J6WL44_THATH|nr:Major facilitator superfamily protein [Thalictrum thalictroides]